MVFFDKVAEPHPLDIFRCWWRFLYRFILFYCCIWSSL